MDFVLELDASIDLILNLSFLVALTIVSGFVEKRWPRTGARGALLQGLLFGGAAVLGMMRPLDMGEGLIFDGRSVMVSLCALFFGPWSGAIAAALAAAYRISLGGGGATMGVCVTLASMLIGLFGYRRFRRSADVPSALYLYVFGLIVHAAMVALMLTLPAGTRLQTMMRLGPPVMILYPLATILAGKILADQVAALRAEATLRRNQELLDRTQRLSRIGGWEWDVASQSMTWTDEVYRIHDLDAAQFDGDPARLVDRSLECYAPEDRERVKVAFETCVERGEPYEIEARFTSAAGRQLWVRTAGQAVVEDDRVVKVIGNIRDVTGRKQAEARLTHSHDLMRYIIEHAKSATAVLDRDLRYVYVSQRYIDDYGLAGIDLIGKDHYDVFNDLPQRWIDAHHRALAGETVGAEDDPYERADGTVTWTRWECCPWYEADGTVGGIILSTEVVTDRVQAELALKHSHDLMRYIIEHNRSAVAVHDRDLRYIYVSQRYIEDYHVEEQDLIGRHHYDVFPDLPQQWREVHRRALAGEVLSAEDDPYPRADGTVDWTRWECRPWYENDGTVGGIIVYTEVITERKLMENALRESEETYRALVNGLPDIVMRFDREGRHLFVSGNVRELVALDAAQFIGKTHQELGFPMEQCRFWEEAIQRVFDGGAPYETEFAIEGVEGHTVLNWRLVPEYDADGAVFSVLSITRDVTAHRQAEEDYQTLFREMLDGFALHEIICDDNGTPVDYRFLRINPAFERMTGLAAAQVVGKRVLEILPGTEPQWIEAYGKVALTGEPLFFQQYAADLDKHFEVTAFRPASGQFACIFADVTPRIRAEEERQRLENQFLQAQKMEAVGRLAGGVAHDFNNMLAIITGHADIAMMQLAPDDPLSANLEAILTAAGRSSDLTRQLLAFARRQNIAPKVLDLNRAVESMLGMLMRLIGEDIDIAWRPAADLWPVKLDPTQVDQVLANLCVNARDAIGGVGKITIETCNAVFDEEYIQQHTGFRTGEYVCLAVSDDGCGMDSATLASVFEPFFTTKAPGAGTGLGLATIYGIVKQNDGFINVYSEPEKGTTFRIYLPRHVGEVFEAAPATVSEVPVGHGETILLVEDEPALLDVAAKALERHGYHVLASSGPIEAIRLASEHTGEIELLVTDVVMPDLSGRDLARNLLLSRPAMKCLFMSGYTANVIAHRGVLDEGVEFIQKPFPMRDLVTKAREVLDRGNGGGV